MESLYARPPLVKGLCEHAYSREASLTQETNYCTLCTFSFRYNLISITCMSTLGAIAFTVSLYVCAVCAYPMCLAYRPRYIFRKGKVYRIFLKAHEIKSVLFVCALRLSVFCATLLKIKHGGRENPDWGIERCLPSFYRSEKCEKTITSDPDPDLFLETPTKKIFASCTFLAKGIQN
jgi:hypothetical protein